MTRIAIFAQGEMGAGVAGRLVSSGVRALTCLEGRSEASRGRAAQAGMEDQPFEALVGADMFLSIVPPGQALALAERVAAASAASGSRLLYVDCNAVSPASMRAIADVLERAGLDCVDAGIIGGPPRTGEEGPRFYASGPRADGFASLREHGLRIETLEGPVGAASALKMAYGGITKGMTAIGAAMILAAERAGVAAVLRDELERSQKQTFPWLTRQCLGMIPKAYRWVDEMEEIAAFQRPDGEAAALYEAIARLYARLAADERSDRAETDRLRAFFG